MTRVWLQTWWPELRLLYKFPLLWKLVSELNQSIENKRALRSFLTLYALEKKE